MRKLCLLLLEVLLIMTAAHSSWAIGVTKEEMSDAQGWVFDHLAGRAAQLPFEFSYGGEEASKSLSRWKVMNLVQPEEGRVRRTTILRDSQTSLEVKCVAVEYKAFPTVEWTVYFTNTGKADTPVISDIRALDVQFQRGEQGEFTLHHNRGTLVKANDFEPLTSPMPAETKLEFAPPGGRPCGTVWPYFNLEWPGQGVIVAVGWPGQWSAEFARDRENGVRITAGQQETHFVLHPGEQVRTPLMVLQFYRGDWLRGQNIWRRWMVDCNIPRPGGKLPEPMFEACSSHQFAEMINANEENQKLFVDRYLEEGLKLDYWWMDAGWYVNKGGWPDTGTWEVDSKRFPKGLKAITDHAHAKGVRSIVWFEPERVRKGTWLCEKHPEWMLGDGDTRLLNLGSSEALKWLTDHVDKLIRQQGIDLYRQDYNINPLGFWQASDAPDRKGITENHYVTGYLAYWDELRRRHPDMLIDTCASGGHRNDLETLRRAVPLLRSDYIFEPVGQQGHTYGLAMWVPFFGTGSRGEDAYSLRSTFCSAFNACWDVRSKDINYAALRRLVEQWREYAPDFLGDYYPLTPYSLDDDRWIAWQFDRPGAGSGMAQAFRRAGSPYETAVFKLQGLDLAATYILRNLDADGSSNRTGKELMENGLAVTMKERPGSAVFIYRKQ